MRNILLALVPALAVVLFLAWPRGSTEPLHVVPQTLARLEALKPQLSFAPDAADGYTGVASLAERAQASAQFARLIDDLARDLPRHPDKRFVLARFKTTLRALELSDTEDRERATLYCEKIMDVLGIRSSDGTLNAWLYGPLLGPLVGRHV